MSTEHTPGRLVYEDKAGQLLHPGCWFKWDARHLAASGGHRLIELIHRGPRHTWNQVCAYCGRVFP